MATPTFNGPVGHFPQVFGPGTAAPRPPAAAAVPLLLAPAHEDPPGKEEGGGGGCTPPGENGSPPSSSSSGEADQWQQCGGTFQPEVVQNRSDIWSCLAIFETMHGTGLCVSDYMLLVTTIPPTHPPTHTHPHPHLHTHSHTHPHTHTPTHTHYTHTHTTHMQYSSRR